MNARIRRLGIVLLLLFGALLANLTWLQVVRADHYANAPGNTRVATRDFAKPRGTIQSADGVVVAQSVPTEGGFGRLRQYPEGPLFAHITGYFSFTFGTDGVERTANGDLTGRQLPIRRLRDVVSDRDRTGNVTLTVSKRLQQVARDALGDRKGAVVALDPTTGAVLALWGNPTYDPNPLSAHDQNAVRESWESLQADPGKPMLPRSYRERYAPGSTFKVITAAAALEKKPELTDKNYPALRTLDLPQTDKDLPNFGNNLCGGNIAELLRVSCNTGFAQVGMDLGAEDLAGVAADFGFRSRPPIDLPAAATSVFPEAGAFDRNIPALAQSAIGQQDVSATPLQIALVAAAIANGGTVMEPYVIAEVRDSEGEVVRTTEPTPWKRAVNPSVAEAVKAMMVEVVRTGTGTRAQMPGVTVAAKTGTAQTVGDNAHAWMTAFAPAEAPRVAVAVIVESQPGLGDVSGGGTAGPIAKAVLQAALESP